MAIPKFEDFLYPFLYQLKDKDVSTNDMRSALIKHFDLSDEDCMLRTRSGSTLQLNDRIGWCRQWLRRALFIEIPQRGIYRITKRGLEYVNTNTDLRESDLLQYPEFREYSTGTKVETDNNSNNAEIESHGLTPTEQMENAYKSLNEDLAADLLQKILDQSPKFFEHLVVDLMVKMGYGGSFANSALITQYSHDGGIDGIIYEDKLGLDKIYIQAKRYNLDNTVGAPQIQQFSGVLDGKNATKGVFITTSSYSKEARNYVDNLHKKIVLIDGQDLAQFMIEYNVGVSTKQVYEIKRLDSDYFEE